jgi:hypothetical protein
MIFLFGNNNKSDCPLWQGADFMMKKDSKLHPGNDDFYLTMHNGSKHGIRMGLDKNSDFKDVDCKLSAGEAAIVIGHCRGDGKLRDGADIDVTAAALRLMTKIAQDNPNGGYNFFLAACSGAVQQPGAKDSLLSTLVQRTAALADQLLQGSITCWGYAAEAGLVNLDRGLPANRIGTHIYGARFDEKGVYQHYGYDFSVTARLKRENGKYDIISDSKALCPIQDVINWYDKDKCQPDMEFRFKNLYDTVKLTSK